LISRTASSLNSRVNCLLSMTHLLLHKTPNSVSSEPGAVQRLSRTPSTLSGVETGHDENISRRLKTSAQHDVSAQNCTIS
jgi:hypothetical protein